MEGCEKDAVVDVDKEGCDIEQFDILKTVGKGEKVEHNQWYSCLFVICLQELLPASASVCTGLPLNILP